MILFIFSYLIMTTCSSTVYSIIENYKIFHNLFISMAMLGFVFFDLLYIAVTINFCYQCQLLKYYIENIIDKVQNRKYKTVSAACRVRKNHFFSNVLLCCMTLLQEIYQLFEFLRVLNGKVSFLMSLVILVFLTAIIDCK